MGLDLSLLPYKYGVNDFTNDNYILTHTRIDLQRDKELFNYIKRLQKPFPKDKVVRWYGDQGLTTVTKDELGNELKYCLAEDFKSINIYAFDVNDEDDLWNKAIILMMRNLAPKTPVILFWR